MNEAELSEYCRRKGLYAEQVESRKQGCIQGARGAGVSVSAAEQQSRQDRKRIREPERELRHKEKARAETAALLVLRKKAEAIRGKGEDE